jgi:hypothetical protein
MIEEEKKKQKPAVDADPESAQERDTHPPWLQK